MLNYTILRLAAAEKQVFHLFLFRGWRRGVVMVSGRLGQSETKPIFGDYSTVKKEPLGVEGQRWTICKGLKIQIFDKAFARKIDKLSQTLAVASQLNPYHVNRVPARAIFSPWECALKDVPRKLIANSRFFLSQWDLSANKQRSIQDVPAFTFFWK